MGTLGQGPLCVAAQHHYAPDRAETIEVQSRSIANVMDEMGGNIDYLKIDTEGAELDVLQGATQLLTNSQIDYIQFEYGGTYPDAGITLKAVYEYLTQYNYQIYRISRWQLTKIDTWQDWMENYKYGNFLAVRSGKELKV